MIRWKSNKKDKYVCKFSICPLTYENIDHKYHLRSKRKVLGNKFDYEQANNKFFTSLLTTKIHHMLCNRLTCIQVRKRWKYRQE
jgi:hypothetical protein